MACNAPYVNRSEAMNRRRRQSSLVDTQPSEASHQPLCLLLCLVFIVVVYLGNKVIVYPLSLPTS